MTVTVQEAPPVVVAPDAADDSYATPFNTPLTVPAATGVLANDTGSRPMTAAGASDPPGGTVTLNADGSLSYTPDAGFSGPDSVHLHGLQRRRHRHRDRDRDRAGAAEPPTDRGQRRVHDRAGHAARDHGG